MPFSEPGLEGGRSEIALWFAKPALSTAAYARPSALHLPVRRVPLGLVKPTPSAGPPTHLFSAPDRDISPVSRPARVRSRPNSASRPISALLPSAKQIRPTIPSSCPVDSLPLLPSAQARRHHPLKRHPVRHTLGLPACVCVSCSQV